MLWSIVQILGKQGITLLIFSILALLLSPTDFGVLGMAMTWIAFIQAFSEMGFGAALIQRKEVDSIHFSTTFFINIAVGVLLTLIGIALSWVSASFFATPDVQPVVAILSISFLINAFSLTQMTIAQREMRFRDLAVRDISASVIGGVFGVSLAWFNFGVWSLVAQALATNIIGSLLIWNMSEWKPSFGEFSLESARDLWPYSSSIFAFNIFKYFTQNADKLLIGHFLGPVVLGLYVFAFKLVVVPISSIIGAVGNYLFPLFSSMQKDSKAIHDLFLFITKAISSIITPLVVFLFFSSPTLVGFIWGVKWVQAIPLIQILAVVSLIQAFISPVGQLMKALNRPGWLFIWSAFIFLFTSSFILLGINNGIVGATVGLAVAHVFALPIIFFITIKLISTTYREILETLLPSAVSSLLLGLFIWWILNSDFFWINFRVIGSLILGFALYLISLSRLDKAFLSNIFQRLARV